ncbi:rhodanese-like domain-containing protein [Thalassolituus sp.]|uniref:rhodanese-like domain-containing protein n=1 Tax=Thalassolituus sp. TaxID=2030822 RepID=UPI002A821E94|nr:rhodanese-like domain-containing protein [Thalassolituus sp.]
MKKFGLVTATDISSLLAGQDSLLLDCRKVADYKEGHIEDALHAHDGLVESLIKKGDRTRRIVIYCYTGHSSEHLAELFSSFGFNDVYSVEGGYASWQQLCATK